ncbi:nuclear pore complex protein Nup153 [Ornithorhynchus anatinus]|uniref:nuclear pore complex protein Nup153 n=1 Tax=Ornithorhynchus anatinus TaxID=9258 RepID=UPI0010A882B6|nr:nuclear pore complex protein Nup153 [Ornithorhynchus anatinus]
MASGGAGAGPGPGGGGGGKIRARRCHQAPAKPYPRGRRPPPGILSRVTESVKNIVPGWLQRYFNKNEDTCVCPTDTGESRLWPENAENDHLIYSDEESPVIHDGRITPEPAVSSEEEPSTSRSALNFPDVLTRPSLHRSHLNFSVLDSPALHCQPSTSAAFPIGGSGFSLVKEIKDSTSQHDDDNISTTSGFSSRASDKDLAVSKNPSMPPLWSPEAERPHTLSQHTAASSKKPAFNLSAFGTLSPSLGNSSALKSSHFGDSPFYPGKTTYGGAAAAARQSKVRNTPYQAPVRRQVKAKPVNSQSYGVTSSTARRILQSLEKMSSPLADARRIPSAISSPLSSPFDRSGLDTADLQSKRKKVDSRTPPVQRLMTPKAISIATNRSVYFKPSLSPATELRKTSQRIDLKHNVGREKALTPGQKAEQHESNFSYPDISTPANGLSSGAGGGGKMRREKTRPGTKPQAPEDVEVPVLPKISLPISTASLPSFNFCSPTSSTASSSPIRMAQPSANKVQATPPSNPGSPVFRFSSPIVKSTEAEVLPPSSIGFTFSVPVVKSAELPGFGNSSQPTRSSTDVTAVNSTSNKKENEDYEGPFKPAKSLKEGSVLDILKSPGFTSPKASPLPTAQPPATSTVVYTRPAISSFSTSGMGFGESGKAGAQWQCDTCLLQNKVTDGKCVACQSARMPPRDPAKPGGSAAPSSEAKPTPPATGTVGFGDRFKPAAGTWDCDTCLVQNKPEATKCVACETPKPGTGVKPALTLPVASESSGAVTTSSPRCTVTSGTLGFGDKFKKPKGSWECPVCCVQNKAEDSKCVACSSEKPGGSAPVASNSSPAVSAPSGGFLGFEKFKKPEGSWDCEVCLVQNKAEATKCAACESAKPGTKPEVKGFGTPTTSSASSAAPAPAFKFGLPPSSSEPPPPPPTAPASSTGFKFGDPGGFKLGASSSDSAISNPMSGGFKFSQTVGDFKFGVSSSDSKSEEVKKDSKGDSGFSFGLASGLSNPPPTAGFQFGTPSLGPQEKKEELGKPAPGGFAFGTGSVSAAPAPPTENKTGGGGFGFGAAEAKPAAAAAATTPFLFPKSEGSKDGGPAAQGGFSFGGLEPAARLPSAPVFGLGRTEEKKPEPVTSATGLVFGKKTGGEEPKSQLLFSFGKPEQTKDESPAKQAFSFSLAKPAEKEADPPAKSTFAFGVQAAAPADQGAGKPALSLLSSGSSNPSVPTTGATGTGGGSLFGGAASASNPPVATFVFGQTGNAVSGSAFGNPLESGAPQPFSFSQESKPAAAPAAAAGAAVAPFVFGPGAGGGGNPATSTFSFGASTTASAAGSSSFVFGSGTAAASASPVFGAGQTPTFGQSQGAGQPSGPGFGALPSSTSLFSAGSQPPLPTFGSVSSSGQPPVFGQPPSQQAGFGSGSAPSGSGGVFQFGSSTTNFNFTSNNPTGVFTFGANAAPPAPSAQPSSTAGFPFGPVPAFAVGTNGKNVFSASGSSVSGRKIKTAVRRRK